MVRARKSATDQTTASAQVFLRTKSGRSLRELASGKLPPDLDAYRAPAEAVQAVVRCMERLGFQCFRDEMGLAVTIQGATSHFVTVFGGDARKLAAPAADREVRLPAPKEIDAYVEEIVMTPRPELFKSR